MPRFKLTLEYAGTRYGGWQIQKNARTVQGELEQAVRRATGAMRFELYGSGRTDAGVHALRQVAHLDLDSAPSLTPEQLCHAINDHLPADVNVLAVEPVPHRFHARHGAIGRSYLYQISRRRTAFGKRSVWWVKDVLDVERMRQAARAFVGLRDFRAFTADTPEEKSTRVLVDSVEIEEQGALILVRIRGSHFLWKMVRRIVGVLVEAGRGRLAPDAVPGLLIPGLEAPGRANRESGSGLLASTSPLPAQLTAPPSGLFLEQVLYEGESFAAPLQATLNLTPTPAAPPARPARPAARSNPARASRHAGRSAPLRGRPARGPKAALRRK
jgi:tRNA pseudouridine38-40 synthase